VRDAADGTSNNTSWSTTRRQIAIVAILVTLVVAARLVQCALETGNYEGMWFSLVHTVIVALGVIAVCRA